MYRSAGPTKPESATIRLPPTNASNRAIISKNGDITPMRIARV